MKIPIQPIQRVKPRKVNPVGPRNSKIVLLGEYPGKDENETGIPFTGSSGNLLTQFLKQTGIERSDCYITYVIKFRPPNNQLSRLGEYNISISDSQQQCREELSCLQPNVIIPLGELALETVTGLSGISKYRGSILRSFPKIGNVKVIPTLHPSHVMKMYKSSALVLLPDPTYGNDAIAALLVISEKRFTKLGFNFINMFSYIYIIIFKFSLKFAQSFPY